MSSFFKNHDEAKGEEESHDEVERNTSPMDYPSIPKRSLRYIDRQYICLGCLGHGGFGSVFLTQKESGRKVALKVMHLSTSPCNDEEYNNVDVEDGNDNYDAFLREIKAFIQIKASHSIIFFRDWFIGPNFAAIEMNYADGGTLSKDIQSRSNTEPYTERRIAWYMLQLCDALAYAHEKGVAHYDVKSSNVLIDWRSGGKLLLADFGTSVAPGEEPVGFSKIYASPELLQSLVTEDYRKLRPDKCDAFALGCILLELLSCCTLKELSTEQTLAEYVEKTKSMPCIDYQWLPADYVPTNSTQCGFEGTVFGYSDALRELMKSLLHPDPEQRWVPSQLNIALRSDPRSPLLPPFVAAAHAPEPGAAVSIDNVQLGMFVQRGPNWEEEECVDGGRGSIGVIVKLDEDGLYCHAAFPSINTVAGRCFRIGAENKFELQIGPISMPDFIQGQRFNGIFHAKDGQNLTLGQSINTNYMVVGSVEENEPKVFFVTPLEKQLIKAKTSNLKTATKFKCAGPRESILPPSSWEGSDFLCEVTDEKERTRALQLFLQSANNYYVVTSIKRVQNKEWWNIYAKRREHIALTNWGIPNEQHLFYLSNNVCMESILHNFYNRLQEHLSPTRPVTLTKHLPSKYLFGKKQSIIVRATLGRPLQHTFKSGQNFECHNVNQIYPEYLITYKLARRIIKASKLQSAPTMNPLKSKETKIENTSFQKKCVVCLEKNARHVNIPCGHVSFCDECSTREKLRLMGKKCPECRSRITSTNPIYL
mmetsp:Transcript_27925/g.32566  ORF Transcript_27925/g.32566 Transcript_27925/m.32566 type:complete len:763 (-) Transcript_27925:54-2342(-)